MSNQNPLGKLADETAVRDAVHVAIFPAIAGHTMRPGESVDVVGGEAHTLPLGKGCGIVDPFLDRDAVHKGDRVYICLYPNTVTGMAHHWSHPAFDDEAPSAIPSSDQSEAEKYIRWFADKCGVSFDVMMEAANDWVRNEEYHHNGNNEMYNAVMHGEHLEKFWKHYEVLEGKVDNEDRKKWSFFSCSC